MNDLIQWGITTVVGGLGIFIGREWQKRDKRGAIDQETLNKILRIIPSKGSIAFIRHHDFGNRFAVDQIDDLIRLLDDYSDDPGLTFIDKDLEKLWQELLNNIDKFDTELGTKSFPIKQNTSKRFNEIQRPEEIGNERFDELRSKINNLSRDVCNSYDKLVKKAKKKL